MNVWLIEPRDPVIFRDGRPFGANPGARARTMTYPFPSTIIGAIRTRAGRDSAGRFDRNLIPSLLEKEVRGPLLVELSENGVVSDWYFPAPADALILKQTPFNEDAGRLVPLSVLNTPNGASSNLAASQLVGTVTDEKGKPHAKAPIFWRRQQLETWLIKPEAQNDVQFDTLGISGLSRESRMHISIKADSQTAEDGALFQTSGLEFTSVSLTEDKPPQFGAAKRLALALTTDADVSRGIDFLGAERRTVRWLQSDNDLPTCPDTVRQKIREYGHCRLILLTPGLFDAGYLPKWVNSCALNVSVKIVGVAVNRYQTVSGWDYDRGSPKPSRRLAPAGSVYFLKLTGEEADIDHFIDAVWMHNISDHSQDRLDGFGLAVLGVWDGNAQNMEVRDESQS